MIVTKRPAHLKIFPDVWVLPGGIVEYGESMETALFREIEEEVGITFEYENDDPSTEKLRMISPLRLDYEGDFIDVDFKPFYLYESVTNSVLDDLLELSGYQDRTPSEAEFLGKLLTPVS